MDHIMPALPTVYFIDRLDETRWFARGQYIGSQYLDMWREALIKAVGKKCLALS